MSKVDDIVAARAKAPELPSFYADRANWRFSIKSDGGLYISNGGIGELPRKDVPALIAWLVENYGEAKP